MSEQRQQVQVNFRLQPGELALIDRTRGSTPRNSWLRRVALAAAEAPLPEPPVRRAATPSKRAPYGCRVLGAPDSAKAGRQLASQIQGQMTVDEVIKDTSAS